MAINLPKERRFFGGAVRRRCAVAALLRKSLPRRRSVCVRRTRLVCTACKLKLGSVIGGGLGKSMYTYLLETEAKGSGVLAHVRFKKMQVAKSTHPRVPIGARVLFINNRPILREADISNAISHATGKLIPCTFLGYPTVTKSAEYKGRQQAEEDHQGASSMLTDPIKVHGKWHSSIDPDVKCRFYLHDETGEACWEEEAYFGVFDENSFSNEEQKADLSLCKNIAKALTKGRGKLCTDYASCYLQINDSRVTVRGPSPEVPALVIQLKQIVKDIVTAHLEKLCRRRRRDSEYASPPLSEPVEDPKITELKARIAHAAENDDFETCIALEAEPKEASGKGGSQV
eukprot:TRINITY_DN47644_c0_g1_i1.p1 TRINITY_DN47644_c0_g1~~TRINITY_DN47644_c0_g1_i1.p1  ORF type:complete len:380 (+),score=66.10 TRINITY_DN47644_c0_g1_i1:111-1142(+)